MRGQRRSLALGERRAEVARLLKTGMSQKAIAVALAVHPSQVTRDLAAIRGERHAAAVADVTAIRDAEVCKLDRIEREASAQFEVTGKGEYLRIQIEAMRHRAGLLGLDSAARVEVTTPDVGQGSRLEAGPVAAVVSLLDRQLQTGAGLDEARVTLLGWGIDPDDVEQGCREVERRLRDHDTGGPPS